jgi:hypothetical protein
MVVSPRVHFTVDSFETVSLSSLSPWLSFTVEISENTISTSHDWVELVEVIR